MNQLGMRCTIILSWLVALLSASGQTGALRISGSVLDPSGRYVAGAHVEVDGASGVRLAATSGGDGGFAIEVPEAGEYTVRVEAAGFGPIMRRVQLNAGSTSLMLRLEKISAANDEIVVSADVSEIDLVSPDP